MISDHIVSDHPAEMKTTTTSRAPAKGDAAGSVSLALTVNGTRHALTFDPRSTLLDLLRDRLDLTGTKKGCDHGQCGACTVLVDGRRINSCLALALSCDGTD